MRYLVKFKKTDNMIYISHLDMQRLFHRTMKRLQINLRYSSGFNPHPKLSFAQPLSLGHASTSEYLEFEVEGGGPLPAVLKGRFNAYLPEGFRILEIWHLPEDAKSVAAQVAAAKYRIEIPFFFSYMEATMDFFGQEHIITEKTSKKTKRSEKVNIRPQIISLKPLLVNDNIIMLTSMLHCGSLSNLNPELMLRCFYQCSGKAYDRGAIRIERVALLGWGEDELLPLEYLQGAGGSANP